MAVWQATTAVWFRDVDGMDHTINIGNGSARVAGTHIVYEPPRPGQEATFYFNISDALPQRFCTFAHLEDDVPRPGFYFARDTGNCCLNQWGNTKTATFMLRRERATGTTILGGGASYAIVCH